MYFQRMRMQTTGFVVLLVPYSHVAFKNAMELILIFRHIHACMGDDQAKAGFQLSLTEIPKKYYPEIYYMWLYQEQKNN